VREVGVKKVFGASQKQLFTQFLFESIILCFISSLFAILIIRIILPEFNHLTGGHIALDYYHTTSYIIAYFLIVTLIGFLAGIYPAIRLSSFNPIQYLRRFGGRGVSRSPFRTILVIFQFTTSIILILSVFVVIRQLSFMKKYKTGFNTENIILLRMDGDIYDKREAFKNEIMSIPDIQEIAFTSAPPGTVNNYEGFSYEGVGAGFPVFTVDPSFLPMLGVKITEGRNFDWQRPNDRLGVCILNREAVESIGPAIFCFGNWFNTACIKINPENMPKALQQIETVWNKFAPGFPFEYQYLDEFYGRQFQGESTLSRILVYFAFVAILIACLGLLGLSSFLAQEKTREIGIRKVFGATSTLIIKLLSANFLKWVIVAIIIGSPVAVIMMNKWLMNFAFHTSISWWLIVLAAIILLSVSLVTIIFHIIRVSRTNPVNALKYE
jgi:putative ABC transport system permease protein